LKNRSSNRSFKAIWNGETPIPCVACNSRLKFASLDKLAQSFGCDKVATGHYARVEYDEKANRYRLFRGKNHWKDQSYFLWELTQDQLSRAFFRSAKCLKAKSATSRAKRQSLRRRKTGIAGNLFCAGRQIFGIY
jgi:tRNA U34 2-thiouridine synthase MnmA/TrmU